jgi:hypothetical protein
MNTLTDPAPIGPLLFLDTIADQKLDLAALFVFPLGKEPAPIEAGDEVAPAVEIARFNNVAVWRSRFRVPAQEPSTYRWMGQSFDIAGLPEADLNLAYVSCNGEEHGDLDRNGAERNAIWARLQAQHDTKPLSLLLHGGDQIYADEATRGHPLSDDWPDKLPRDPSRAVLEDLRMHLREKFLERYIAIYSAPEVAHVMARVPSLMQWDDHDICDGWGSLQRSRTYSPVGQTLFDVAREAALLFQHACKDGDLPPRFFDASGLHLGWEVALPGLRLLGPDLRSERTRREVMGTRGWQMLEQAANHGAPGRTFVLSSVPLLGPRLSILEMIMVLVPSMQKYEDDLRDQWQSRAHRESWQHMLELMQRMARPKGQDVTVLSGEIHLATRGEMPLGNGKTLHQLVASGIAHRAPPRVWARILHVLAHLGDSPLSGHPISINRIPGQPRRYVPERNYLTVSRRDGTWQAEWEFETSGTSPALPL